MFSRLSAPFIVAFVFLATSLCRTVYAALPDFPPNSISPLFGKWYNAMGKGRLIVVIGPEGITSSDGSCRQRSRYQVISKGILTVEGEKSVNIIVKIFAGEFLGRHLASTCSPLRLSDAFIEFNLVDQGAASDAQVIGFVWRTCDTLEHLKQPVDPAHLDIKSCGAGGGIMSRD